MNALSTTREQLDYRLGLHQAYRANDRRARRDYRRQPEHHHARRQRREHAGAGHWQGHCPGLSVQHGHRRRRPAYYQSSYAAQAHQRLRRRWHQGATLLYKVGVQARQHLQQLDPQLRINLPTGETVPFADEGAHYTLATLPPSDAAMMVNDSLDQGQADL